MLTFDKKKHEYYYNGRIVPSVTQIIPKQKFFCTDDQLENARQEGEDNHSLIKMFFDSGDTFGDKMLEALKLWLPENEVITGKLIMYESPLFSANHVFAGRPDAIFEKAIIDFKRSSGNSKYHALQLSGYHILATEKKIIKRTKRHLIMVYDGEKFSAKNVYRDDAEQVFFSLLKKYQIDCMIENYFKN